MSLLRFCKINKLKLKHFIIFGVGEMQFERLLALLSSPLSIAAHF